jgi:plastocyanin
MAERKIIRMPKFHDSANNLKYFEPRYIEIRRGETIEWLNDDTKKHMILSHKFGQKTDLLKIGPLIQKKLNLKLLIMGFQKLIISVPFILKNKVQS